MEFAMVPTYEGIAIEVDTTYIAKMMNLRRVPFAHFGRGFSARGYSSFCG